MPISRLKKTQSCDSSLKLLVVGKGNESRYRKIAADSGIGQDIHFAGVRVGDVTDIYMAADIFSMLSTFDTFGMTVLEAMAASLPVIVSHNVGAKDLVREGVNGFIVGREDIEGIGGKITCLLDREQRIKMGIEARKTAEAHTWERIADKTMGHYEKILSGRVS